MGDLRSRKALLTDLGVLSNYLFLIYSLLKSKLTLTQIVVLSARKMRDKRLYSKSSLWENKTFK